MRLASPPTRNNRSSSLHGIVTYHTRATIRCAITVVPARSFPFDKSARGGRALRPTMFLGRQPRRCSSQRWMIPFGRGFLTLGYLIAPTGIDETQRRVARPDVTD